MYNWSTDEKSLPDDPAYRERFYLEQLINYGLNGKKIDTQTLRRHWTKLDLDPDRRRFLEILLNEA